VGRVARDNNGQKLIIPGALEEWIKKARRMLGQLNGTGNSQWGISATS